MVDSNTASIVQRVQEKLLHSEAKIEVDHVDEDVQDDRQSPMEDPAEKTHFKQVVSAFFFYEVSIGGLV